MPYTKPVEVTRALLLDADQEPPATASERVMLLPRHTDAAPVIVPALGNGLTETTCVAVAAPQPLAMV